MTSPQWKNFQPPMQQDPAILSFQRSPDTMTTSQNNNSARETGFIEKMLHSYGFIQCCEREARLFFHFSEYNGDLDSMKIGDPVEFQMSYDRRTGKPIASIVIKSDPETVTMETIGDDIYQGTIMQEAKPSRHKNGAVPSSMDGLGRVTYHQNGECFFLTYGLDDIKGNTPKLKAGDQVKFQIGTDKRDNSIAARNLVLFEQPQQRFDGVVCSMKDSFGFIERADIVKEIFFHYSEFSGNVDDLMLGDDVEFNIQSRNGKEVAVDITCLPQGTVIFEDISVDHKTGTIMRPLKPPGGNKPFHINDPLPGRLTYKTETGEAELPFGDKDQDENFTLLPGDSVEFQIATDRRDKLHRATNIQLVERRASNTEKRETGVVMSLKDGFGFIHCADRDARMFFHFTEVLEKMRDLRCGDDLEFTVTQDPSSPSRQVAIRVKYLPKGTVSFQTVNQQKYIGTVDREPATHIKNPAKNKDPECGNIIFDYEGAIQHIGYAYKDLLDLKNSPRFGDKVEFQMSEQKRTNVKSAVNVRVVLRSVMSKLQGYVATLKDNYGFIENSEHDKEVFFHFSAYEGDANDLDLGDEVEYTVTRKSAKVSAENICKLQKGTIPVEEILKEKGTLTGVIIRPMRIVNPGQDDYPGLVQVNSEQNSHSESYTYGITSLADKRDFLQCGDAVKFQVAKPKQGTKLRAVNIAAIRKYIRARVDSVKGQYGFINYEVEPGKKLFYHQTEVHDGVDIQAGDDVEFVVVQNQRNKKYSACSVRKLTKHQRPERLLSRLKSVSEDIGNKVIVIRQPRGPDGSRGFSQPRKPWQPVTS